VGGGVAQAYDLAVVDLTMPTHEGVEVSRLDCDGPAAPNLCPIRWCSASDIAGNVMVSDRAMETVDDQAALPAPASGNDQRLLPASYGSVHLQEAAPPGADLERLRLVRCIGGGDQLDGLPRTATPSKGTQQALKRPPPRLKRHLTVGSSASQPEIVSSQASSLQTGRSWTHPHVHQPRHGGRALGRRHACCS
jgi:hypothetical protein